MFGSIKAFIAKLQKSPEPVRFRWMIGLSGGTVAIVVALWVGYLNVIVKPTVEPVATREPGFAATFGKGLEIVFGEAKEGGERLSGSVKEILGSGNELSFERQTEDFIMDGLPPVPRTRIP